MRFMFPDDRDRARRLPRLFAMLYDSDAANLRLVTPDVAAVTLWRPPGTATNDRHFGWWDKVRALWIFGPGLPRARLLVEAIKAHFPTSPFWYLHIAGCAVAAQGRRLGSAAVQAGLMRATDAPTYLETANEANLGFYRSLGFEVIERWRVPDGPVFWSMLRAK
ncbi:N-acetyltransferase [Sphingomonas sp. AX6]|nr:N-acetyltransferase [Sphingomonas sp. AX6]